MASAPAYSDIVFRCHGRLYISGDLIQVATDEERRPAIFVRPDYHAAFLMSFNDIGVLEVQPLTIPALRYWRRHCRDASDVTVLSQCVAEFERAGRHGTELDDGREMDVDVAIMEQCRGAWGTEMMRCLLIN